MTESDEDAGSNEQQTSVWKDLFGDVPLREAALEPASRTEQELSVPAQLLVSAAVECARDGSAGTLEMVLSTLAKYLDRLSPEVVELVARAKARSDDVADAARGLVYAAERWRLIGEWSRALTLCQFAHSTDSTVLNVHRTWGLALLATGDAEGARGHLQRWREENDRELDARIWSIEALWSCGRRDDAKREVRSLAETLEIRTAEDGAARKLRRAVEAHLERAGDPLVPRRANPFWRADAILEQEGEEAGTEKESGDPPRRSPFSGETRPAALVAEDISLAGIPISDTLEKAGYQVVLCEPGTDVVEAATRFAQRPNVIVVPIRLSDSSEFDRIREIRESATLCDTPILGVVDSHGSAEHRRSLRVLGVVGLVDRSTSPSHLIFRLNRIVHATPGRRLHERAPAFFPLTLEAGERTATEYALSLSVGGIGITSEHPIDLQHGCSTPLQSRGRGEAFRDLRPGRVLPIRCGFCPAQ